MPGVAGEALGVDGIAIIQKRLVTIPYSQLLDERSDLSGSIQEAYGDDGLGVLTVSGIPGILELRARLLHLAVQLGELPSDKLTALEDPASSFCFGWSRGKETLENGQPDYHKGSFYANPMLDDPASHDPDLARCFPAYYRPNKWPKDDLAELEGAFKALGQTICEVGLLLAKRCSEYASQVNPQLPFDKLHRVLAESKVHKGRLLTYFPTEQASPPQLPPSVPSENGHQELAVKDGEQEQQQGEGEGVSEGGKGKGTDHGSAWCGWHTDHGSLTGLACALYLKDGVEGPPPDPTAGLYVRDRAGEVVSVKIPSDHIGYQVGEAMQIHSGGALRATPHYVKSSQAPGVMRTTLAVFLQPDCNCAMDVPEGVSPSHVAVGAWSKGQTFGEFSKATLNITTNV